MVQTRFMTEEEYHKFFKEVCEFDKTIKPEGLPKENIRGFLCYMKDGSLFVKKAINQEQANITAEELLKIYKEKLHG